MGTHTHIRIIHNLLKASDYRAETCVCVPSKRRKWRNERGGHTNEIHNKYYVCLFIVLDALLTNPFL